MRGSSSAEAIILRLRAISIRLGRNTQEIRKLNSPGMCPKVNWRLCSSVRRSQSCRIHPPPGAAAWLTSLAPTACRSFVPICRIFDKWLKVKRSRLSFTSRETRKISRAASCIY